MKVELAEASSDVGKKKDRIQMQFLATRKEFENLEKVAKQRIPCELLDFYTFEACHFVLTSHNEIIPSGTEMTTGGE